MKRSIQKLVTDLSFLCIDMRKVKIGPAYTYWPDEVTLGITEMPKVEAPFEYSALTAEGSIGKSTSSISWAKPQKVQREVPLKNRGIYGEAATVTNLTRVV
jgi:hypothetical protein